MWVYDRLSFSCISPTRLIVSSDSTGWPKVMGDRANNARPTIGTRKYIGYMMLRASGNNEVASSGNYGMLLLVRSRSGNAPKRVTKGGLQLALTSNA